MQRERRWYRALEAHSIILSILVLCWIAVIWVDVFWQSSPNEWPLWYLLFLDNGIVEHLAWLTLAATSLMAVHAGTLHGLSGQSVTARFWRWYAVGVMLLLIEDSGDTSFQVRFYINALFGTNLSTFAGRAPVFGGLAAVMVIIVLVHRDVWFADPMLRRPLLLGFVLYGVASTMSIPLNLFIDNAYFRIGDALFSGVFRGQMALLPDSFAAAERVSGGWFVESAIEESIEVLGAAFLATVAFRGVRAGHSSVERFTASATDHE